MSPTTSGRRDWRAHCPREEQHLVDRDGNGRPFVAEHDHRSRVADEDDVDAGILGEACAGRVVGGDHDDLVAAALHRGELGKRQLSCRWGAHLEAPSVRTTLSIRRTPPTRIGGGEDGWVEGRDLDVVDVEAVQQAPRLGGVAGGERARQPGCEERAARARAERFGTRARGRPRRARCRRRGARAPGRGPGPSGARPRPAARPSARSRRASGRTMLKSLQQTVATARKCPGRNSPSSVEPSSVTSIQVWKPSGYISSTGGANRRSTPASAKRPASRVSSRG